MDIYLTGAFCENYTCVLNRFGKQSQIVRKLTYMGDCTSHTDELLIEISKIRQISVDHYATHCIYFRESYLCGLLRIYYAI